MSIKSNVTIGMAILLAATVLLTQCGKKESEKKSGCDESSIQAEVAKMQGRLDLNEKQVAQFIEAIHEIHKITDEERAKYKGDNDALLKAAKERNDMKKARMESFLDDKQKAKFREIMSKKQVSDRALLLGEQLGLDCEILEQVDAILKDAPYDVEEYLALRKSQEWKKVKTYVTNIEMADRKIFKLLTKEQAAEYEKIVDAVWERLEVAAKTGK